MKKLSLIIVSILIVHSSFAASVWSSMGSNIGGKVRALCVHNGTLYAGGDFSGLVKKWDGVGSWIPVGELSGTRVNVLYVYNGVLYAGGLFSITGSASGNVARLSGSTWVKVGDGLGGTASEVRAFGVLGTVPVLHAGGKFTNSGSVSAVNVAKLNSAGTAWSQAGAAGPSKCSGGVYALMNYYSELYAGGVGTSPFMNKLSAAGQWADVAAGGPDVGTGVYALGILKHTNAQDATALLVGGNFAPGSSSFQQTVARLTFSAWSLETGFSTGANVQVNCFASSATPTTAIIYAGGAFAFSGANPSTNIAKKIHGQTAVFDSAGSPAFNAGIRALCFYNGYLVAGGDFTSPGTYVSRYATTVDVEDVSTNILTNTIYPNPVINEAIIMVQTINKLQQPELRMLDVNGNEMVAHTSSTTFNHSQNEVEFKIEREGLASGFYYYIVLDEDRIIATGKVIVE